MGMSLAVHDKGLFFAFASNLFLKNLRNAAKPMLAKTATKLITIPSVDAHFSVTPLSLWLELWVDECVPGMLRAVRLINVYLNVESCEVDECVPGMLRAERLMNVYLGC